VILELFGHMTKTIKPRDLVRTPGGATGHCIAILPNGEREIRLLGGGFCTFKASVLFLVREAPPLPWKKYVLE
jgi:hypothetical protein